MSRNLVVDSIGLECRPAERQNGTLVKRPIHLTVTRLSMQTRNRLVLGKALAMNRASGTLSRERPGVILKQCRNFLGRVSRVAGLQPASPQS
jgi:hypothetical protein